MGHEVRTLSTLIAHLIQFSLKAGAENIVGHPTTIDIIARSFNTLHLPSRRIGAEILTALCYYNDGVAHEFVLNALEALSAANDESGIYSYWFHSLCASLERRYHINRNLHSTKYRGTEAALHEYVVRTFPLYDNSSLYLLYL